MRLTEKRITTILRQRGYKLTPQRKAVLKSIALSQNHLTTAEIYDRVHEEHPGIGLVTIYRTLDILNELGIQAPPVKNISFDSASYLLNSSFIFISNNYNSFLHAKSIAR